jgi:histidinol-phosphate/aromatic aminotransferase/cobyric acid decarboxylase-like protein
MSGIRFGVLYTHNKEVASAMKAFGYHHGVSGITQYKLCRLLQDKGTKQDLRKASWLDFMAVWDC